jgi:hypothetical protein
LVFIQHQFGIELEKKGATTEEEASVEPTQSHGRLSFHLRLAFCMKRAEFIEAAVDARFAEKSAISAV